VDPDRAPRDVAPAADAAGRAELVVPGRHLVRQPLPVTRSSGRAHAAAVDVRVIDGEARVPDPPALGMVAAEVTDVLDVRAETRRTDERAVPAREATRGDVVPPRILEIPHEQVADVVRVEGPPHPLSGARDRVPRGVGVVLVRRALRQLREDLPAALGADFDEE